MSSTIATATTASAPAVARPSDPSAGMTVGLVRAWLRVEGLAAFVSGVVLYLAANGNAIGLVPLLLLPDLSIVGYLAGPRVGALAYNVAHTWTPGLVVLGLSAWLGSPALQLAGATLIAHVGMDRAFGYGLKLPTSFSDTHLGRIGRARA